MNDQTHTENSYQPGHPWYYKLGGKVFYPKEILNDVKASGYKGYLREEIHSASLKQEPARSNALRKLKSQSLKDLRDDLRIYRQCALELYRFRATNRNTDTNTSSEIDMSMSLKHNHIYNQLAHIYWIDELLSKQPDLFGF